MKNSFVRNDRRSTSISGVNEGLIELPESLELHPSKQMWQKTPDSLEFFRTELQKLAQAPEPTIDPVAVSDLKRIITVRIAELETDRARQVEKDSSESDIPD